MKPPALYIILLLLLNGCRTVEYIPAETVRSDTIYVNRLSVDTVLVRDSIRIMERGDTVTEFRYKYVYRYKDRVDTLYLSRADSIQVPYPVEKQLTRWQQVKVSYGGWAIFLVSAFILIVFGRLVYKMKKQ